jgi:hypothetical protein
MGPRVEKGDGSMRRTLTVAAVATALVAGGAPLAAAAPPEREIIPLVCDDGQTFSVEVNGNGEFTPGRVVGTNQVLVPVSFGEFTFRAVLPDGTMIEDSEPGSAKGGGNVQAHNPRPTVTCTFEITEVLEEEQDGLPTGTGVTFGGEVTGFLTGR